MQIRLVTGVNIRLCFQIDIKYIQILFSPKSSSCGGLRMGLSTPSDSPRSLRTEGDSSASRAVCAGSAEELQLPFTNSLPCFWPPTGKKPILATNPSSWWWKSSGSSCGAHLPPTYRWCGPQGVIFRPGQGPGEPAGKQLAAEESHQVLALCSPWRKGDGIAHQSIGVPASQGGESCFLEKPSQIKAHIENIRLSMML